MILDVLAEVGEGGEFEGWVGEDKALLGEGDFFWEVFDDVNAGDEEERQDVKPIGALGSTLLDDVEDLLMEGLVCAFELGVKNLGLGEAGFKGLQEGLGGSLGFWVTASVGDEEVGWAAQEIYQVALLWFNHG